MKHFTEHHYPVDDDMVQKIDELTEQYTYLFDKAIKIT